jgi:hypothetical protein
LPPAEQPEKTTLLAPGARPVATKLMSEKAPQAAFPN